jgi:hypothetical protein
MGEKQDHVQSDSDSDYDVPLAKSIKVKKGSENRSLVTNI